MHWWRDLTSFAEPSDTSENVGRATRRSGSSEFIPNYEIGVRIGQDFRFRPTRPA